MKSLKYLMIISFALVVLWRCGDKDTPVPAPTTTPYTIVKPDILPIIETIPEDNPMTVEGVELGRKLFYDPIMSRDNTIACATCHDQSKGFTDGLSVATGIEGRQTSRSAMSLTNLLWMSHYAWNGAASSIEEVVEHTIPNPQEMDNTWEDAVSKLSADNEYPDMFYKAFGTKDISENLVSKAIAQFVRTFITANSRYDKVMATGNGIFFTDEELNGFNLFNSERGDCFHCHAHPLFTDRLFHNTGLDAEPVDVGRYAITGNEYDMGRFRTPTLRNIAVTAPYMHDGRFATLREVLDFYSDGVHVTDVLDPLMVHEGGINLTETEKDDLIAFLNTLTDTDFLENSEFSEP